MKTKITLSGTEYNINEIPIRINSSPGPWKLYMLTFPDGMRYIGISREKNLNKRWKKGKGYRTKEIKDVTKKYGWDSVKEEILYEKMSRDAAGEMEKKMIAKYQTLWPFGYNHEDGGFTDVHVFGRNTFPVKQIDPNTGETVHFWRSAQLAAERVKGKDGKELEAKHIRECANDAKGRKAHGGWKWKRSLWEEYIAHYKEWEESLPKVIHVIAPRKRTEETVAVRYVERL